ncbi:MAG: GDP-mannose 4,6-dehydratase [Gemmatimonadota bacterium]
MKILITGGAGFTGINFARHYLERGHEVVVLDNLSRRGGLENLRWLREATDDPTRLEVLIEDVRLPGRAVEAAVESADLLLHFAAQVAVTTSVADPAHDFDVNALGTFRMLELVRRSQGKRPAFFYSSTNKVYGGMEDVATVEGELRHGYVDLPNGVPESRPLDFHSPYGCSKGAADQYVRDYARIFGLRTVVFRQSCIYGYRQFGIEDQGWVAWFVIAAELGRPLTIFGDGKQVRDILFIDDLIGAYDAAWRSIDATSGGVYNLGGGPENAISLLDLLGRLGEIRGEEVPVRYDDWRPGDQPVYVSDIEKARAEFGWEPGIGWRDGVGRLVEWVRENRALITANI